MYTKKKKKRVVNVHYVKVCTMRAQKHNIAKTWYTHNSETEIPCVPRNKFVHASHIISTLPCSAIRQLQTPIYENRIKSQNPVGVRDAVVSRGNRDICTRLHPFALVRVRLPMPTRAIEIRTRFADGGRYDERPWVFGRSRPAGICVRLTFYFHCFPRGRRILAQMYTSDIPRNDDGATFVHDLCTLILSRHPFNSKSITTSYKVDLMSVE